MRSIQDNWISILLGLLLVLTFMIVNDEFIQNILTKTIFLVIIGYNIVYKSILFKDFSFNRRRIFLPSIYDIRSKIIDILFILSIFIISWLTLRNQPEELEKSGLNYYYFVIAFLLLISWALLKNPVTEIIFTKNWIRIRKHGKTEKKLKHIDKIIIEKEKLNLEYGDFVFEFSKLRLNGKVEEICNRIRLNDPDIEIKDKSYSL